MRALYETHGTSTSYEQNRYDYATGSKKSPFLSPSILTSPNPCQNCEQAALFTVRVMLAPNAKRRLS